MLASYSTTFVILATWFAVISPKVAGSAVYGAVAFDPVAVAKDRLEVNGTPPPAGFTVREARKGELGNDQLGKTDLDSMEIVVDARKLGNMCAFAGGDAEALIIMCMGILEHEYAHTPDYGTPSIPPATGFSNDVCSHTARYELDCDVLCDRITAHKAAGGVVSGLCRHYTNMAMTYNGQLSERNKSCPPPPKPEIGQCAACE